MRIQNAQDVLKFWEEVHGTLDAKWIVEFLKHQTIRFILNHDSDKIKVALRRNQKLEEVLIDLENQVTKKEDFDRQINPYYDSKQYESQSKIEQREKDGGRWGRTF